MEKEFEVDKMFDQAMRGFVDSHNDKICCLPSEYGFGIYKRRILDDNVRIIVNGGGGYGPMWLGLLGEGLPDATISGYLNAAPNAYIIYEMGKKIAGRKGVLLLTNNFMGDYLNNDMALELLAHEGIPAKAIYVTDDIYSSDKTSPLERTGLIGIGQICKIAAAAASSEMSLDAVYQLCFATNRRIRSLSMLLQGERFLLGKGIAGDPEKEVITCNSRKEIARCMIRRLLDDYGENNYRNVYISLSVNRVISYVESYSWLFYLREALDKQGIGILGSACGTYLDVYGGPGMMVSLVFGNEEINPYLKVVSGNGFEI